MGYLESLKRQKEIMLPINSGKYYSPLFTMTEPGSSTITNSSEMSNLLTEILDQYEKRLTLFQKDHISRILEVFSTIADEIEPERLTSFNYFLNDDDEFLIYRNSRVGLTNIIIHDEDCLAFSFIGKKPGDRELVFYEEHIDYEKLAYKFFAK